MSLPAPPLRVLPPLLPIRVRPAGAGVGAVGAGVVGAGLGAVVTGAGAGVTGARVAVPTSLASARSVAFGVPKSSVTNVTVRPSMVPSRRPIPISSNEPLTMLA
ncbi:hypothetical protein AEGHOMDF_4766 [Methylobacterium soli]|nr:hypothetical protein AEGHOMDF_4766 [Methylobacterium soli]